MQNIVGIEFAQHQAAESMKFYRFRKNLFLIPWLVVIVFTIKICSDFEDYRSALLIVGPLNLWIGLPLLLMALYYHSRYSRCKREANSIATFLQKAKA
ncbi:hypothetical protein PP939_gp112 [Rhizobium phage RL38J1]|uniref:Transmembrane protein n=1 Tax=Rhizobium phage RL38J1 TaxID=2663232 RepID=A0A6B9J6V2_9CAUD|nr:hypothetical protein PP939_gp112 [Rhizobium phage RL38J1]QGZ13991.1 hypothetical protein RL38J1_112 [Rhizobium phage RL38J1]